jgi:transcriptional regulator with XRE-family HTH domain
MYIEKLKGYLSQNGISIKQLCTEIGMTEGGFHQAVKANSFKISTLEKISEYLKVPLVYWLTQDSAIDIKHDQSYLLLEIKYLTEKIVDQKERIQLMNRLIDDLTEQNLDLKTRLGGM